jgi:AcrR family transcriptional regulator
MGRRIAYETVQRSLDNGLHDLQILSGDVVGPSGASVRDVVETAKINLGTVLRYLEQEGGFGVFPEVRLKTGE